MTVVLAGLMQGLERETVLAPDWAPLREAQRLAPFHPSVAEVASGSFRQKQPPEIIGSGYVVRSLEAALWAFYHGQDFRDAVLKAVNLGDDADTTGAVCGQFSGAYFGRAGIPLEWRQKLAQPSMVEDVLERLLTCPGED